MYVTNCCLTNAYSDPDVRQVTSHAGTLCADQKLAVPESVKLKISSRKFIKCSLSCSYPALNADVIHGCGGQQGGDVGKPRKCEKICPRNPF